MINASFIRTYQAVSARSSSSSSRAETKMPDYNPGDYYGPDDTAPGRRQSPGPDDTYDPDFGRGRYDDYGRGGYSGGGGCDPDGSGSYNGI